MGTRKIGSFSSHQIPPAVISERLGTKQSLDYSLWWYCLCAKVKCWRQSRHEWRKPYLTIPFAVLALELGVNNPASDAAYLTAPTLGCLQVASGGCYSRGQPRSRVENVYTKFCSVKWHSTVALLMKSFCLYGYPHITITYSPISS